MGTGFLALCGSVALLWWRTRRAIGDGVRWLSGVQWLFRVLNRPNRYETYKIANMQKIKKKGLSDMNREEIIQKLRARGCRITKQRLTILDIILEGNCSSCKEIHYKASKIDPGIGIATVYRMVNSLEEIGAITRRNIYLVEATV